MSTTGSISVRRSTLDVVVRMRGEIDVTLHDDAARVLDQVAREGLPVVVDLADVRFVGATGLTFLVQCAHACGRAGVGFRLRNVPLNVDRVLGVLEVGLQREPLAEQGQTVG